MVMTTTTEEQILSAVCEAVKVLSNTPTVNRLDGDGWRAYRVGEVIRVDIKQGAISNG